ncbi:MULTISPECIES: hypothetical protein [Bacteria]|uniref:hypothetical protein n=1 Tax=Bacteria TaxID=2 RepID=UPI003642DD8C
MTFQQEHLPKDKPATSDEQYGFAIETFLEDQWPYLVGILLVIFIFFYARYRWDKRHGKR